MSVIQDALGRITQFIWCGCGSLAEIVDPLKQITTFERDLQGRITSKTFDDGKKITYKYENTISRLKAVTDAKGQVTNYSYYLDDNLKTVKYSNAVIPTDSVFFSYDDRYNRLDTMKDGTGITAYFYKPINPSPTLGAGRLQKIDGPLPNDDIVYTYDSLGRVLRRTINGIASSVVYDALGRVTSATNVLGTFGYSYVNATARLAGTTAPNGTSTAFTYYNNLGDQRLQEIWNKTGSSTLSKFNYEYNREGQITKWTQQLGSAVPRFYELGYDLADQLTSATQKDGNTSAIVKRYAYQYDKSGNRTSEQIDTKVTSAVYNTLNQLTAQGEAGPMRFAGKVDEFAGVLIKNNTSGDSARAVVDSLAPNNYPFEAFVNMKPGVTNKVFITATDSSGNNNRRVDSFNVAVGRGIPNALTYDANGNTVTVDSPAVVYSWDAADRLVKVVKSGITYEFVYDGLSRRVAQKTNGAVTKRWLWCGTELCEERNAGGGTVTKRFFPQGEQVGSTNYYFTRDHLGSVRELTDAGGNLVTRYDYDPYGRRTRPVGTVHASFGYTGHYFDSAIALNMALYRSYDARLGRWLNRDPIGEIVGLNLYKYVDNNVINNIDLLGLWKYYGNWGGPDWTGGQKKPYEDLTEEEKSKLKSPIDAQDECYRQHDLCYSECRVKTHTTSKDKPCKKDLDDFDECRKKCDLKLAACLNKVNNTPSASGKNGHSKNAVNVFMFKGSDWNLGLKF